MGQKTFTDNEIKTLRQVCVLFNDKIVSKTNQSPRTKRNLKSLIKYRAILSDKDIKILQLICKEYTTDEIADEIGLSSNRIEQIRGELLKKTKSKNIAGLVKFSIKNNIYILK